MPDEWVTFDVPLTNGGMSGVSRISESALHSLSCQTNKIRDQVSTAKMEIPSPVFGYFNWPGCFGICLRWHSQMMQHRGKKSELKFYLEHKHS